MVELIRHYIKTIHIETAFIVAEGIVILFLSLLRVKKIYRVINAIANDTLKRDGKWSTTYLTMFSAWVVVLWSYHYNIIKNGFSLDAFILMCTIAMGAKITDAVSKKINPIAELK